MLNIITIDYLNSLFMAPFIRHPEQSRILLKRRPARLLIIRNKITDDDHEYENENFVRAKMAKRTNGARTFVDLPSNEAGYSYHLAEKDPEVPDLEEQFNNSLRDLALPIPTHIYRVVAQKKIKLSANDRDLNLFLGTDGLTVAGFPKCGYGMIRATHPVSHGSWYYEVEFVAQPDGSHTRIGWAQQISPLSACVGFTKFSYGWRSKHGTAFHQGYGKRYFSNGYTQGDVIGCLISLPSIEDQIRAGIDQMDVLPDTKKHCHLIKFRRNNFFEDYQPHWSEWREMDMKTFPHGLKSRIEFFLNGESCGVAYEDLFRGHYFPALSLFQSAQLRCNFGPSFRFMPDCVRDGLANPMSDRPAQMAEELLIANKIYMEENIVDVESQ